MVQCGWDDVPHLDEATKARLLRSSLPHTREARSTGKPSLGAGAIYPIELREIQCEPFALPEFWPKAYALDVGWKRTAALWGARDPSTGIVYLYSEHYRGQAEPAIHAAAIKARGDWIPGVIDPAARGRGQKDGERLMALYQAAGLKLALAENGVDSGLLSVWELLSTQRLKVFKTLQNFAAEYGLYRRDENGKIVKEFDHLMDCMRYLMSSGMKRATVQPLAAIQSGANLQTRAGY
jgi:hypothetical protein